MSEKQTDIVERPRAENADPRNWRRMYGEAADEIEALRADLDKCAKLALSAVAAERAAILAMNQALASAEGRTASDVTMLSGLAAAIQAREGK